MPALIAVFLFMITSGCTTNASGGAASESFSLVSPGGITLANDLDDLKNIIIHNSGKDLAGKDIAISAITYNETDTVSFGIVNFTVNAENRSMLVPLKIDDHLALLVDSKNIYIRKIASTAGVSFDNKDAIFTNATIP
ncbi:MAG: hypothetical protein KDD04_12255, partial [Sinomicrobium sp.]|nr:hypothetical protein [Sinomicrobium sp.]